MNNWYTTEGAAYPLGVSYISADDTYNFALYSKNGRAVSLFLYTEADTLVPVVTVVLDPAIHKSQHIWHCRINKAALMGAEYYAYSVSANPNIPGEPAYWQAFDPEKILLDPYAREVFFPAAFDPAAACRPGSNAGKAPLGYIHACANDFDWQGDSALRHDGDLIIYELHVKGFTMNPNSGVTADVQGTFAGITAKVPYLQSLGITAVELMPSHQYDPGGNDYWGYSTLNFFSPHGEYASDKSPGGVNKEFKTMVRALHKAGIEVIMDVVFNHTTEGDNQGPVYSFKGIDNSTYYLLDDDRSNPYMNQTCTGNTMRTDHPVVQRLIVDSLVYWVTEMHIDGFRFDLAAIFTVTSEASTAPPPIFAQLSAVKALQGTRLIAEPWYSGTDLLGNKFPGNTWRQWNGAYRDDLRQFVKGTTGLAGAAILRLYGSNDLFPDDLMNSNHPYQSVNFINCHDGFTLYDLVAYNNPVNSDGGSQNSWNCGWEGDSGVPQAVIDLRIRQAKNFMTLLMLSNGTAMFVAGDEFLHSQGGNSNPYNKDDVSIWLDWDRLQTMKDFNAFMLQLIQFRKAFTLISRSRFWNGDLQPHGFDGNPVNYTDLGLLCFSYHLADTTGGTQELYVMVNAGWTAINFTIATPGPWKQVINTYLGAGQDIKLDQLAAVGGNNYLVGERSVVVLCR